MIVIVQKQRGLQIPDLLNKSGILLFTNNLGLLYSDTSLITGLGAIAPQLALISFGYRRK
ncbi:MAG: hypothetical protein RMY28_033220 [Nostoc sp. ChiSLP01]|nr:hypothetical protein [Nostoc sp. CmiSLP01]MDZ8287627.1 hypothetical protein [Nostoc sp. ChiSLP01]